MSISSLAAYRELYRTRHGIACPLSDAQIRTALAAVSPTPVREDEWPLSLAALAEIEAAVVVAFPSVDQNRYLHGGTLTATDPVADNPTVAGFDVNFSLPTGGNPPYSIQLQIAPDDDGDPGTWADKGTAQDDATEIVLNDLVTATTYHVRLVVTDNRGETVTTGSDSIATS